MMKPLSELAKISSGGTPSRSRRDFYEKGTVSWVKSGELNENIILCSEESITEQALKSSSAKVVPSGTVLLALYGANVGRVGLLGVEAATNQAVATIECKPTILFNKYLFYFLISSKEYLVGMAAGGAQQNISQGILSDLFIPLPSIHEQKQIAALLDSIMHAKEIYAETVRQLNFFQETAFINLFGDPQFWSGEITIEDVVTLAEYGTSTRSNGDGRGLPVLGMSNITYSGELNLSNLSYVELDEKECSKLLLKEGDIIFNRTNSTELVGKTALWTADIDAVLASYLVKLRVSERILPEYFVGSLNSSYFKKLFQQRCKKAVGQSNISPTLLKEFPFFIPQMADQEKFAQISRELRQTRVRLHELERQLDQLFRSTLARSFDTSAKAEKLLVSV